MGRRLNVSGLVVAGIGFFLTRFTVTLAIYESPLRFYLAGVVPLALGLGLAAFGVALAVADVDTSLVRTTTLWCVIGFVAMLVLVVLTLLGSSGGVANVESIRSRTYLSNFLIGGSVGGTLTGLYAARNRQQRSELQQQTNRLVTLHRLLRHEVLNAVTAIRGYAQVDPEENPEALPVIRERSNDIQGTIEEMKYLVRRREDAGRSGDQRAEAPTDLDAAIAESVETVTDRHPDADVSVESSPEEVAVYANERLAQVFTQLLENAVVHGEDDSPTVAVTTTRTEVAVSIEDGGPGLPESQRTLLETGDIEEFDNPRMGFGLNVVRLLVEGYDGTIETDVGASGTTVTVVLPRAGTAPTAQGPTRSELAGIRPATPHLIVTFVAAVLAGVPYGIVSELLGGSVAAIGVFYGTPGPVVGWLTHEFHSVVFGFVFLGLVSIALERYRNTPLTYVAVGIGWALVLWIVAAGFVGPIWLRLLGIPASVPSFSVPLLVSHLAWGLTLSLLTAWGYSYATRWVTRFDERLHGEPAPISE